MRDMDPRYAEHLRRKQDPNAYSVTALRKVEEERQRQKAKKRDKKKKAKGGKW